MVHAFVLAACKRRWRRLPNKRNIIKTSSTYSISSDEKPAAISFVYCINQCFPTVCVILLRMLDITEFVSIRLTAAHKVSKMARDVNNIKPVWFLDCNLVRQKCGWAIDISFGPPTKWIEKLPAKTKRGFNQKINSSSALLLADIFQLDLNVAAGPENALQCH